MLLSARQNELFDLLVTAIWWTKAPELLKLFKRSEKDEIHEVRDPHGSSFVTTATWWFLKTKNLCIPLQNGFPAFWEFLGIPDGSQKFPTLQISCEYKKAWNSSEFLGIKEKSSV